MFDQIAARKIAERVVEPDTDKGIVLDEAGVRELREGWFFPYRCTGPPVAGSEGVIINKLTGKIFELGSAYSVDRDLDFYDKGYQFKSCDLVITSVSNVESTVDILVKLRISTAEPKYEHGTVWRVPRPLTRKELSTSLTTLPHVFGSLQLYFRFEILEEARKSGAFAFELLEYRPLP